MLSATKSPFWCLRGHKKNTDPIGAREKKTGLVTKKGRHGMRLTVANVRRAAERHAYARLRHAHFFGVTYRLAPHDKPPKVVGDATVQIVSSRDTDRSALSAILYLIEQSLWSGSMEVRAEHQWAHVGRRNEGSISKSYLVNRIKRAAERRPGRHGHRRGRLGRGRPHGARAHARQHPPGRYRRARPLRHEVGRASVVHRHPQ